MSMPLLTNLLLEQGRYYKRVSGQVVLTSEDKQIFNYLRSGFIKRYMISKQGTLGVQSIYGPGNFFPLTAAFQALLGQDIYSGEETYHYEAMGPVEIYCVNGEILLSAASAEPLIYKEILNQAGDRFQSNIQQLENMSLKDAYRQVAHQLAFYGSKFSTTIDEGTKINLPLKQQDIADILSLNRETVTRVMIRLRDKGLIITGTNIIITDLDALKNVYR